MNYRNTFQAEKMFYQDSLVSVTQAKFIIRKGKSFAIDQAYLAENTPIKKTKRFAVLLAMLGNIMLVNEQVRGYGFILIILGLLISVFNKEDYAVKISSDAGEQHILMSKDKFYIQSIVDAVNETIIYRIYIK